jgi:hypothetical protein
LQWRLLGSICISGPTSRLNKKRLLELAQTIMQAANQLSYAIAGNRTPALAGQGTAKATWHP